MTLYTELLASKGVVLVRADIVNDQTVSVPEVRSLCHASVVLTV